MWDAFRESFSEVQFKVSKRSCKGNAVKFVIFMFVSSTKWRFLWWSAAGLPVMNTSAGRYRWGSSSNSQISECDWRLECKSQLPDVGLSFVQEKSISERERAENMQAYGLWFTRCFISLPWSDQSEGLVRCIKHQPDQLIRHIYRSSSTFR